MIFSHDIDYDASDAKCKGFKLKVKEESGEVPYRYLVVIRVVEQLIYVGSR